MKPSTKKEGNQNIPKQYILNNVTSANNEELNNLSILEQYMDVESIQEAYGKLCNINNIRNICKNEDESQYFHCDNIMKCKANV